MRRIQPGENEHDAPRAVAFRKTDAALAVAYDSTVVLYRGWLPGTDKSGGLYNDEKPIIEINNIVAHTLSWSRDGTRLCAVGQGLVVWEISKQDSSQDNLTHNAIFRLSPDNAPVPSFALGCLSPDGRSVAASTLFSRTSWVWIVDERETTRCAQLTHGPSGIAGMDWKPRGGGNSALMTIDRDASVRLWIKIPPYIDPTANKTAHWIEEIARCPHAENTKRAGASFLDWGGGGGCAEDEADARAMGASEVVLSNVAPKPSRCVHWIIRVAAGNAQAWRVRGLDDRPRAEYARLEPGSGDALHGAEYDQSVDLVGETDGRPSLRGVSVIATKSVAPIPLTTSSQRKEGLVRSYAISNGERLLRSPEPPNPPNVAAVFVLLVRNGTAHIARYDISPVSNAPAVCRARVVAGHTSPIVKILSSRESLCSIDTRRWLISRGSGGDVFLWRTDVAAGHCEPVSIVGRLCGPHTCVAFAPRELVSDSDCILGLFGVDAAFGDLRVFAVNLQHATRRRSAVQNVVVAEMVSTCYDMSAADTTVRELFTLPLQRNSPGSDVMVECIVFGLTHNGHVPVWYVTRSNNNELAIIPIVRVVKGRGLGRATAAATCIEGGSGKGMFVAGGSDGCLRVYSVSLREGSDGRLSTAVVFAESAFLGERDGSEALVCGINISAGGTRIASTRTDGSITVWEKSSTSDAEWSIELSHQLKEPSTSVDESQDFGSAEFFDHAPVCLSTGRDQNNNICLIASHRNGQLDVFRKPLGTHWERSFSFRNGMHAEFNKSCSIAHIGPGFVATASGRGISVFKTMLSTWQSVTHGADAAGYSPSRGLMATLLIGGTVDQIRSTLTELNKYVVAASQQTISSNTYGAGRGLVPPAPPLSILLASGTGDGDPEDAEKQPNGTHAKGMSEFAIRPPVLSGKSLFAELMARSEAQHKSGDSDIVNGNNSGLEKDSLLALAHRLRSVSLTGVSREEQNVLAVLARSSAKLRQILPSLDAGGARFALITEFYRDLRPTVPIPPSLTAFALHSSSVDALMDYFIPAPVPRSAGAQRLAKLKFESGATESESLWVFSRSIGAGWWASTSSSARKLVERIARSEFMRTQKAEHATLWYVALGRHSAVAALFKAQQDMRMATFFKRNFALPENKTAASKNAYVLVAKHRLLLATAFFILAGDVKGALNLVKSRIRDEQLYILLARILKNGEYLNECLETVIKGSENRHTRAMAMWLNGKHEQAVRVASETERVTRKDSTGSFPLVAGLPPAVFTLGHVLAMSDRPPVKGMDFTVEHVQACRWAAVRALQAHESPSATLKATYDLIRFVQPDNIQRSRTSSLGYLRSTQSISAAVGAIKSRAVSFAGAIRSGVTRRKLLVSVQSDLVTLLDSFLDLESLVEVAVLASTDLSRADEVDAAVATALAGNMVANEQQSKILNQKMMVALESCLRVLVSRALSHVHCAVSLLHQPLTTKSFLDEVLGKTTSAIYMLDESSIILSSSFDELIREFKGTELALRFGVGFLGGDWLDVLSSLRSCETLWPESVSGLHPNSADRVRDGETCSSVSAETVSVEALRHMASNPAVLGMSPGLGHRRRKRRAPSMTLIAHHSVSAATVPDETGGIPTLSVVGNDPLALIRIHPALSSTLCASALAYLSTHLASRASRFEKYCSSSRFRESMNSSYSDVRSLMGFRLIDSTEALEHLANDAMAGWVPLPPFGAEAHEGCLRHPDVSAGAFVDLWTVLGCLPEYAPVLSEAATVAAAELAGAASRAAVEAAEVRDGGRRMRRRRERKGERVLNVEKEGLQHLDTTADLALYGAYPVRFSSSARGPWSGRGRNASLYQESSALFRKLCVSSTDPPSVVVATPKGIQEIVPSSYTTMPAGFRSHYLTQKQKRKKRAQERKLEALEQQKARDERAAVNAADDEIIRSFDAGFGEGAYIPLSLSNANTHRSTVMRNKKAIWRHQVEATALCSHPFRRRFATGGTDGCVRLWDFTDPVCIASFRETRYGRVTDLSFSAYGSRLLAVHSSGHVAIWNDPDNYRSLDESTPASRRRKAQLITAFDNRAANGGIFVDEQHTIAVVGDPMAPPVVGDSLRVFDTRDANSAFRASWSARVHDHGESRCIALLEDRVRIVSGGVNGSLSVVDLRTRGCIAELPAHEDEVTCLGVEWPRERAIASGCRNGDIKVWDSRTLLQLDVLHGAHTPTRHYWSGSGIGGLVGSYGTTSLALTNRSLISCGGDGVVKVWGPGFANYDLHVL